MSSINNLLEHRKTELQNMLTKIENAIETAPEGRLRISHSRHRTAYYCCLPVSDNSKSENLYLNRDKEPLAKALAKKATI